MKFLRMLALATMVAAPIALVAAEAASATVLTGSGGTLGAGTSIAAEAEGTVTLDPPFGSIECKKSSLAGKTTNAGGTSENVSASIETLSFSECNATVTVLAKGSLSFEGTGSNNGALRSTGTEVTVEFIGTHCIFRTSNTSIGTVTGSANTGGNATLDISATIPRTGGRSGAFCGSTAAWTGSYKFTSPSTLNIDSGSGGATSTTITTSLSGEAKSGEEITVNEGSKVKDTATLSGTNAGKATGTVKYKVYADKECKELVTSAGEVTVTGGSVPASEEKTLEAGRVYYWQAEYSGDSNNLKSTSACGKEVLTVKASTSLSTSLSGEEKSGEEIEVKEEAAISDTATLSGTNASKATGKVKYKVYADSSCEELIAAAGEVSVSGESVPASSEEKLFAGIYYWQAEYGGDSTHLASMSPCGSEIEVVREEGAVEPSEDLFEANESVSNSLTVKGIEEVKVLGQSINESEEGKNFKLESECVGKTLKPKAGESASCLFSVQGESFAGGREGELTTKYEAVKTKRIIEYCTPLNMAKGNESGWLVLRVVEKGRCFPYDYGQDLEKGETYKGKFEVAVFGGNSEFELVAVTLSEEVAFKKVAGGTSCAAGVKVKKGVRCTIEVTLTPNKEGPENYVSNLTVKYEIVGEPGTVYERVGRLIGHNPP
ncbi:MAG TPA: hypothetical protein VFX44_00845 [Solirubrobacterales bacterium]|nr:hypothetical protein [Solirubrobacterales bacterium]